MAEMNERAKAMLGLAGKVALVTGGGTGLGFAMARCMADAGAQVVVAGRHMDTLEKACAEIGRGAAAMQLDVTDTARAGEAIGEVAHRFGRLDCLVNNAGVHCKKPVAEVTMDNLQRVLNVHVFGAYALAQAAAPHLEKTGGSVLFISSMSALIGLTNVTAYSAAKAAVLGLVKTMAGELSPRGVRVNAIVPGFIDTPMFRAATEADPPRQQKILGHTPMGRYGTPDDVGWAAVYLASDASRFVTGTTLVVDGGCVVGF